MVYYVDLFSPDTFERFNISDRTVSGFRESQESQAKKVHPGDKFICYVTKIGRWVGVLEVLSDYYIDSNPIFSDESDPFSIRFKVNPIAWLTKEFSLPIHDDKIWNYLSFTKEFDKKSSSWTGIIRRSLGTINMDDGSFLENKIIKQLSERKIFEVNNEEYYKYLKPVVKRTNGTIGVTVPEDIPHDDVLENDKDSLRTSLKIQSMIANIGEKLGFTIWIPRGDRGRILQNWTPKNKVLIESLPLNYDDITLRTIEQIDVIWLRGRAIVRAFEIEHTTSVYSGILRMADLLALQPNMDIKLHIVAPESRREKVYAEIQRPVFSLLEKGPLSKMCSYLTYESIEQINVLPHLGRMIDSVVEDYEDFAD
jgi:predicted RNA-binding protein